MKLAIQTWDNKSGGEITLDKAVFGLETRDDILNAMVKYQLAKRRAGTSKVKTRSEVAATGKKAFKQKGTGHARASTLDTPRHRGGGVAHGPVVRSYAHTLTKKMRKLALKTALSAKASNGQLVIVKDASLKSHKTKAMAASLEKMGLNNAVIIAGKELDANFDRATNNIPCIDVLPVDGANVYDILRREKLVLTTDAVEALTANLKG